MSRRPLFLLTLALASVCGAVAVWFAAFEVAGLRGLDAGAMQAFTGVARAPLEPSIRGVARFADPTWFLTGCALLTAVALLRRRWLMAVVVPAILLSANATTQVLKPALADPRTLDLRGVETIYHGSWPSGHSTASMSLALCLVLVVGPRLRPLAAVAGAGYAIAVGYALVALGYHLPSDVFGGYLVAATFTLLGAAALAVLEARAPARGVARERAAPPPLPVAPIAAGGALLLAFVAAAVVLSAPGMTLSALQHPSAIAAGAGIAALGLTLTAGLAVVLRR